MNHHAVGQYQLADVCLQLGVDIVTDLLMTILAGGNCNAERSRVPLASSTYGCASWFMKTSSMRLVPA